jgi:hypothetical protein
MTKQISNINWEAPEFKHYEKGAGWYVTLLALAILVVSFFIFQKDIFGAVCVAMLSVLIILFSRHKPKDVKVELNEKGVHFGNLFYPYKQIKHFWIVNNDCHKTLNLETTAYLNNMVILELNGQNHELIRNFLVQFLLEHERTTETFVQRAMHRLKF